MSSRKSISGFTLIELMVTIAVLAIVLGIALPSFRGTLQSNRVATATNELIATLSLARSEAIRSSQGAGVCASAAGDACDGTWGQGVMVWADTNGNGAYDASETVLRFSAINTQLEAAGPAGPIAFDARGRRRSGDAQAIVLEPVDCGEKPYRRAININVTGQIRTEKGACS